MKNLLIVFLLSFISFGTSFAQRIAYVDTEYVLSKMPEYIEAQKSLEEFTAEAYNRIASKEKDLIKLKATFKSNELLMSDNIKIQEEEKLAAAEEKLLAEKNRILGANGELFQQQQNLIQPLQDRIFNAIKQVADRRDIDLILDKSTGVSILYVKPKLDMSEEVLKLANIKN